MPLQTYRMYNAPPPNPVNTLLSIRGQNIKRDLGKERNSLLRSQGERAEAEAAERKARFEQKYTAEIRQRAQAVLQDSLAALDPADPDFERKARVVIPATVARLNEEFKDPDITVPFSTMGAAILGDIVSGDPTRVQQSKDLIENMRIAAMGGEGQPRAWKPTTREEWEASERFKSGLRGSQKESAQWSRPYKLPSGHWARKDEHGNEKIVSAPSPEKTEKPEMTVSQALRRKSDIMKAKANLERGGATTSITAALIQGMPNVPPEVKRLFATGGEVPEDVKRQLFTAWDEEVAHLDSFIYPDDSQGGVSEGFEGERDELNMSIGQPSLFGEDAPTVAPAAGKKKRFIFKGGKFIAK